MIKLILLFMAMLIIAALTMAVMCAWLEQKSWSDYFENERDGEQ